MANSCRINTLNPLEYKLMWNKQHEATCCREIHKVALVGSNGNIIIEDIKLGARLSGLPERLRRPGSASIELQEVKVLARQGRVPLYCLYNRADLNTVYMWQIEACSIDVSPYVHISSNRHITNSCRA